MRHVYIARKEDKLTFHLLLDMCSLKRQLKVAHHNLLIMRQYHWGIFETESNKWLDVKQIYIMCDGKENSSIKRPVECCSRNLTEEKEMSVGVNALHH